MPDPSSPVALPETVSDPATTRTTGFAVDRWCARAGARSLVENRPGMGWLLIEVIPVYLWVHITGALSGDSYYLVTWLGLLGASSAQLAWLPFFQSLGGLLAMALVLWRPHRDPKWRCVWDTLWARGLWLLTVAWPLLGFALGWSSGLILGGVFVTVLACHTLHGAGGAAFTTWTQAVVPPAQRGHFYAWRNLSSYLAVMMVVSILSLILPKGAIGPAHLPILAGVFVAVTVLCAISTGWLAKAPDLPSHVTTHIRKPLAQTLRATPALVVAIIFSSLANAANGVAIAYLPQLLTDQGIGPATYAGWQAWLAVPGILAGIALGGWGLHRWGGHRLLVATAWIWLLSDALLLALPWIGAGWAAPAVALLGLIRGLWSVAMVGRQQELVPPNDPRFPAVLVGMAAAATLLGAAMMLVVIPWLPAQHQIGGTTVTLAWTLILAATGLRWIGTLLLMTVGR